jgi:hypothetical protein
MDLMLGHASFGLDSFPVGGPWTDPSAAMGPLLAPGVRPGWVELKIENDPERPAQKYVSQFDLARSALLPGT